MDTVSFTSRRTKKTQRHHNATAANIEYELSPEELSLLIGVWKTILDQDDASVEDHFFEIGGTSLDAMMMSARIKKLLGAQISLTSFFDEPTLGVLYEEVRMALYRKANGLLDPAEAEEAPNCKQPADRCR